MEVLYNYTTTKTAWITIMTSFDQSLRQLQLLKDGPGPKTKPLEELDQDFTGLTPFLLWYQQY